MHILPFKAFRRLILCTDEKKNFVASVCQLFVRVFVVVAIIVECFFLTVLCDFLFEWLFLAKCLWSKRVQNDGAKLSSEYIFLFFFLYLWPVFVFAFMQLCMYGERILFSKTFKGLFCILLLWIDRWMDGWMATWLTDKRNCFFNEDDDDLLLFDCRLSIWTTYWSYCLFCVIFKARICA